MSRTSRWTLPRGKLPTLDIELTERCDNCCIHCCISQPIDDHAVQAQELPSIRIRRLLEEAALLGCLQVRFTGGEPLLREEFRDLYIYARRLGMRVMLFTNARRITRGLADLFTRVPPLVPIEVSVYGMTRSSYEAVTRAPGSHAEFQRGLSELDRQQIPYVVKWVVLPPNLDELEVFQTWAGTIPWMTQPPNVNLALQLRSRRDSEERNQLIAGLRFDPKRWGTIFAGEANAKKLEFHDFCRRFLGPQGNRLFDCGFGDTPCVDAYGRLQPCLSIRAPELTYDLDQGTFVEALTEFFPALREVKAVNPDYRQRCARCFLKGLCDQCPAWSWTEHGTLDTPVDHICELAHEQARAIGLLIDKEKGWETADWKNRIQNLGKLEKRDI
ncbi:MAG: radical SAM protein [Candidatus Aminicenantes bacterium]|nr:radical SAM protein [Acidobacteriota bacterium]MBU4405030.1 radical SAM protein [Acidobacteriota bacterium]MCG2811473.1 radical SAM protein [Candidatus Aminicenantes bacterium]